MNNTAAAEPGIVENPFIYNVPVRGSDFYNREKIIDKLLHETVTGKSQGNVWITGERKIGKNHSIHFSSPEIDFCFKITWGYPYFVQKLYSIMYNQKAKEPGSKLDLSEIKKEYGKAFKETLEGWGGAKIPKRTLAKLKSLAGDH